jgi:uncharacterized protein YkwD
MACGRFLLVLLVVLAFPASGIAGTAMSSGAAGSAASASVTRDTSLEELLLREINALRANRGLTRLTPSTLLSRSAAGHSRAMATYGFFTHESRNGAAFSQRIKQFYAQRSGLWSVGENLAMFGGAQPTASAVVAAWMGSPGHRANLLRGVFREAGIGVMFNPAAGGVFGGQSTWVVTLDLGRR